ncbi:acyloxyacyl hydrolase [Flavobacterium urocaniciphilum]|uniref:Lipid A 3-O-deacylase (PagL) n=1 Tax=Flavobacterium urocaniciphilum TaxID=1299341 RepID=A0A1H8YTB2_9FLAO|nr:acyloxyacyl hydrolase [Flavobacterium urocaniciphilum]SEP55261.1 Lipid A 3-O-deacylase (PagL) [Flavobacterium urocaniciphilum]
MNKIIFFFFLGSVLSFSQKKQFFAEYSIGETSSADNTFISLKASQTIGVGFGIQHNDSLNWVKQLRNPFTGVILQVANHGNTTKIGHSISLLPYIETPILLKNQKLKLITALGVAYHTKKYDFVENWENKAISTDFTYAFRLGFYYDIFQKSNFQTRLNLNYLHYSNGHIQWPNNGINTLALGLNLSYSGLNKNANPIDKTVTPKEIEKSKQSFFSIQTGIGEHALYRFYNYRRNVYSFDFMYGKIYNKTHKVGLGLYMRHYTNNYKYIKEGNNLVSEEYAGLQKNPFLNASSLGIALNYEFLMQHIAVETELGFTLFRPFFPAEYRLDATLINQQTGIYENGKAEGTTYTLKRFISGKLGLKYYLFNTNNAPKNNFYAGAHIVSRLGQADYSEFSLGFVHAF